MVDHVVAKKSLATKMLLPVANDDAFGNTLGNTRKCAVIRHHGSLVAYVSKSIEGE